MDAFDYRSADAASIMARANRLVGRTLGDIGGDFAAVEATRGKGEVGAAVERYFGIPPNSRQEADFPGAGIELKVVPMTRAARGFTAKERTVISMIDYGDLALQTWDTATVRHKLHILFVFFEHLGGRPKTEFPVRKVLMWRPEGHVESFIQADWERVRTKVLQGLADQLAESDGRIMGPCTKGPNAAAVRRQPFGSALAKSRAFALKPAFTSELFHGGADDDESLIDNLNLKRVDTFETQLLRRFAQHIGRPVGEIGNGLGVPPSDAKNYAATVVRRTLGAKNGRARIAEFEETGLTLRMTRVDDGLLPYEALSFPAFRYRELLEEEWADSDLLRRVEYMLLVPVHGRTKTTPQAECRLGRPVFWRPSAADLETIRTEWELYRIEIERGLGNQLTGASETVAIHVRPHGRDSRDTDDAPVVGPVVKKSFWLNRTFVRSILRGER